MKNLRSELNFASFSFTVLTLFLMAVTVAMNFTIVSAFSVGSYEA